MNELSQWSNVDIMLIDQVLKGRIQSQHTICDVGCGSGRNADIFMAKGHDVWGCDSNLSAIQNIRQLAKSYGVDENNFKPLSIEENPLPENHFDFVICNAVLHFCKHEEHFIECFNSLWALLKNDGILFCRFATKIGWPQNSPNHSFSFLADRDLIIELCSKHNARMLDPIKTTIVDQSRTMTTLVLKK